LDKIIYFISIFIALAGILIALIRMIKGPTVADRAVSLDVMTIIAISIIVFIACCTGREIYVDVAMVYALISFLGVVAVARYLEGGI
jgi:multicomponent Na+:H+ antiporter subunit F